VQLHHLSRGLLLMFAGGDPWKVDASLQAGRPSQINDLAQAFHNAGSSAAEADKSFSEALKRFEGAWNRENGEHPINDAAEVQRAIKSLGLQAMQLPQIAADLENVAAALACSPKPPTLTTSMTSKATSTGSTNTSRIAKKKPSTTRKTLSLRRTRSVRAIRTICG
jgi:hypothetical protein